MEKSLKLWRKADFVFTGVLGVILHFLYEWTNNSFFVAPFSAVNESIWEHMKLLFFSLFLFSLIEYRVIGKNYKNYWCTKLFGIMAGILSVPMMYYTYTGALGVSADWFNILIFFIADAIACFIEFHLLKRKHIFCRYEKTAFILICIIAILFIAFTFLTPEIPLFMDPLTKTYGV